MRRSLIAFLLLFCGCNGSASIQGLANDAGSTDAASAEASVATQPSDFVPPTGKQANPLPESPGIYRLLLAHSTDGLTFTRDERVLTDQANTASAVASSDGSVWIYYTGSGIDANRDAIAVAVSANEGATFSYRKVVFSPSPLGAPLGDPDVSLLADGTFRMFVTGPNGSLPTISVYDSTDGIHFTKRGDSFSRTSGAMDSCTANFGELWQMWTLSPTDSEMLRASSSDGVTFSFAEKRALNFDNVLYFLSGSLQTPSGRRYYGFAPTTIRSFTSTDGIVLTADPGVCLSLGGSALELNTIKDPAVVRLASGRHLMAYTSYIP